jgi:hypothetical protein
MNDPAELAEIKKEATKLQQFEAKLQAAEIDANNNCESLEKLVELAEEAISLTTIKDQSLFTYFDGDKSYEYFSTTKSAEDKSTKNTFYCKKHTLLHGEYRFDSKTNMQPAAFVTWKLGRFSTQELLKILHTVVFGGEYGINHQHRNPYAAPGFADRPADKNGTYF